jgi:hypothetical protein
MLRYFSNFARKKYVYAIRKIKRNLPQLLSMTGFTIEEFEEFLPHFSLKWEEYNAHFTLFGKERQRIA